MVKMASAIQVLSKYQSIAQMVTSLPMYTGNDIATSLVMWLGLSSLSCLVPHWPADCGGDRARELATLILTAANGIGEVGWDSISLSSPY